MFIKTNSICLILISVISICFGSDEKRTVKRGVGFGYDVAHDFVGSGQGYLLAGGDKWSSFGQSPWFGNIKHSAPSPSEITSAIASAKQASANVLIAQQQVQSEKENVLSQQRIANEKEAHASMARQKIEALSAVQRSEAAAAAQSVILAQQRLGAAKAAVSHLQRTASTKEAQAATAIQKAAFAAAAEVHRTEHEAAKLSHIQRNDNAAAVHHTASTKDALVVPLISGGNHVPNNNFAPPTGPWWPSTSNYAPQKINFNQWG